MKTKKPVIRQPHAFTYAQHQFTAVEKRIIYNVLARMDSGINVQPEFFSKNITFTFNWKDLESKYDNVLSACQKLGTRQMFLNVNHEKQEFEFITPFPYCNMKNGVITITLFEKAVPYFLELKKGFTQFQLKAALSLQSKYSQRLYEILSGKIWRENGKANNVNYWRHVDIDELREMLGVEPGKLKQKSQFDKAVLQTAQHEIKEKADIDFEYEYDTDTKVGKEYKTITFKIYPRQEGAEWAEIKMAVAEEISGAEVNEKVNAAIVILSRDYMFSPNEKDEILTNASLLDKFLEVHGEIANGLRGSVKNPTSYVRTSLGNFKKA